MRLISKIKNNDWRIIKFLGIVLFKYRKKTHMTKHKKVFERLDKYKYVLNKELPSKQEEQSDYVWQLWFQGEDNAPEIIKIALDSVKKHCGNLNRVLLTEDNLKDYIQLPDYIEQKYKKGIITKAHFSDYIRLCLLEKYGGTWIDASCYMTERIPDNILNSAFFQFKNSTYCAFSMVDFLEDYSFIKDIYSEEFIYHTGSSWFLHSTTNNIVIAKTKQFFEEYWRHENQLIDYYLFHYMLAYCVLNDKSCREVFQNSPAINNFYPHILQNLFYKDFDLQIYNQIKRVSFIHKLYWKNIKNYNSDSFICQIYKKGL